MSQVRVRVGPEGVTRVARDIDSCDVAAELAADDLQDWITIHSTIRSLFRLAVSRELVLSVAIARVHYFVVFSSWEFGRKERESRWKLHKFSLTNFIPETLKGQVETDAPNKLFSDLNNSTLIANYTCARSLILSRIDVHSTMENIATAIGREGRLSGCELALLMRYRNFPSLDILRYLISSYRARETPATKLSSTFLCRRW